MNYKEAEFNNKKENLIQGWYIPTGLCDEIIKEQNSVKRLLYDASETHTFRSYSWIDLRLLNDQLRIEYLKQLEDIKNLYLEKYPIIKSIEERCGLKLDIENGHPYVKLKKYEPNKFYSAEHCEHDPVMYPSRMLVFMTYLNTIDDGGGTHFPYQNFTCNPEKGLTLIWPAYFTHPHIGIPSPKEKKYILTGWYVSPS